MGRQRKAVTVNQFAGGLNTEANPLNFPEGASFDEQNCDLLSDGTRRRRNGFNTDFGNPVDTGVGVPEGGALGRAQFYWKNAGGMPGREFIVVQLGNFIGVHSLVGEPVTNNLVYSTRLTTVSPGISYDFADVDGTLVVATGTELVLFIKYDGVNFSRSTGRILIRDMFGVESPGLTEPENLQVRPTNLPSTHLYNLRNQTWAFPRMDGVENATTSKNPISYFRNIAGMNTDRGYIYPSNSDNVNEFLVADPEKDSNRTAERFNPVSMVQQGTGNSRAPMGHFIIDALDRGNSRTQASQRLISAYPVLSNLPPGTLPTDRTTGGATVVAQYAGRIWYGGFQGRVVGGDSKSPQYSSYLFFSQVVNEPSQMLWCYQKGDPTSSIDPDLVDTDGGFLKIDGAYNIKAMIPLESSLFVFAENGVWRVVGADENAFTATSYVVNRVTDRSVLSKMSVVLSEGLLFFWSDGAIYVISRDNVGSWRVQNLTDDTIRTFYQSIPQDEKKNAAGFYDDVTNTIRWVYKGNVNTRTQVGELVFNRKFGVFTRNTINLAPGIQGPTTVSGGRLTSIGPRVVTVEGIGVTVQGEAVTSTDVDPVSAPSENFYVILVGTVPTARYVFGGYRNNLSPLDWGTEDTPAYLSTGSITGGEARLTKDIPYITTHFKRLETEGSCFLQARWDWTSGPAGNRWTAPRQAYRTVNARTGDTTVSTRNRIRGMGKSVAINLSSEPGKFFHVLGWEHNLESTTDE